MPTPASPATEYFLFGFPLSEAAWDRYGVSGLIPAPDRDDPAFEIRKLAGRVNDDPERRAAEAPALPAELLLALRTLNQALRHVAEVYFHRDNPGALARARRWAGQRLGDDSVQTLHRTFVELFPPVAGKTTGLAPDRWLAGEAAAISHRDRASLEILLLFLNVTNPAAGPVEILFEDDELRRRVSFIPFVTGLEEYLEEEEEPGNQGTPITRLLRAPMLASPGSLAGQIAFIRDHWAHLLPANLLARLQTALDVLTEMDVARGGEPGPPEVLEFGPGSPGWTGDYPEPEAFSTDADWMSNVVLMAKSVYVWLDQIGRRYGRAVHTLNDIPDEELDRLARWGVNGLWLIGLWERSEASRRIKQWMGNPDAAASAYALLDYRIADDLGGEDAWRNLSERAGQRGIRLASDMVPNHMGIDSRWVVEHPEYFLQLDHPPYPAYRFTGGDLCPDPHVAIRIEDGYWNHSDAAVVFQRVDERTGDCRYIYHGNDGTSMPWNDTAQLNFLLPEVREAVIQVILAVARRFPIIRFDAAMTLAKKHYQRLWFPTPGDAGAIPSRAEHGLSRPDFDAVFPHEFWREVVDRVAAEAPGTLLLAEAFWLMEGYFVRTLGMHRVYNSAFMNMLKMEDNAKYRQTIKNVLEFSPEVLKRFVNFMNNPDERTAVEQFGKGDKYFGCMLMLVTMPGLPMLGHGQIEGFSEKYGMEYRRAYWDEQIDEDMVRRHEREIFPLMRRRHVFSGATGFALYDFQTHGGWVDENVFAYTNGHGNDRALVIFNNAFEQTAGFVRTSTAINKGSADQPRLVHLDLAAALGIEGGRGLWYIFRDHIEGLEYLRSGDEIVAGGFHTHLNGYQYRAFIDFRSVTDHDGRWAEMAAQLEGRGVPDLVLARRRRELQPALAEVRSWTQSAVLAWLETILPQPAARKTAGVRKKPTKPAALPVLPDDLAALATRLQTMADPTIAAGLGAKAKGEWAEILASLPGARILQAVYLQAALRKVPGPWHGDGEPPKGAPSGLAASDAPLVREDLEAACRDWTGHEFAARRTTVLAEVLATLADDLGQMNEGRARWLVDWLDSRPLREYLDVNTHEGTTWLNREALETLTAALVLSNLVHSEKPVPVSLLDARALMLDAAANAGYDLDKFARRLDG